MKEKEKTYQELLKQLPFLLEESDEDITNLSNFIALLHQTFSTFSWTGIYFAKEDELYLGPFQGKVACTRIKIGSGVCGTVAKQMESLYVENVHEFDGHIACDELSASEIVIPIILNGKLYGVLDIDSYLLNNFDDTDQFYLKKLVEILKKNIG